MSALVTVAELRAIPDSWPEKAAWREAWLMHRALYWRVRRLAAEVLAG